MKYLREDAIYFQAQHSPDSPNHPNCPSTEITVSDLLHRVTLFRFRTE